MTIATSASRSMDELAELTDSRIQLLQHYEKCYYQYEWDRLAAMKPSYHQLAHIADNVADAGPVWVHWQFPMERVCGIIGKY